MPDRGQGKPTMATKARCEVPSGMQRICRRFERWRSSHRGRLPIPEGLWASAAAVAREHGVFQTAKVLRLEYGKLKRMVEAAPSGVRSAAGRSRGSAMFLEWLPPQAVGRRCERHRTGGPGQTADGMGVPVHAGAP